MCNTGQDLLDANAISYPRRFLIVILRVRKVRRSAVASGPFVVHHASSTTRGDEEKTHEYFS